jgi:3',5'-cyclic-AMP phosphodiesterase
MTIFAQITDLHIDSTDPDLKHIDSRANALAVLDVIQKQNIERIIITGDIAESANGMNWFMDQVNKRGFKFDMVLGNHDARPNMEENDPGGSKTYYAVNSESFCFLFLDSGKNWIDQDQLIWINEQLSWAKQDVLIFVHHPVLNCGDSLMDKKFPLNNREEVFKILIKTNQKIAIFCGHYHREELVEYGNIIQYVTPSTLYQIKKYAVGIEVESEAIGYRILSIDNGSYQTKVKYL